MAHRIQLPVEFQFEIEQTKYVAGAIRLKKWEHFGLRVAISSPSEFAYEYDVPVDPREFQIAIRQELAEPGQLLNPAGNYGRPLSDSIRKQDIEVLLCLYPNGCDHEHPPKRKHVNPWHLRHDFLRLRRSSKALLEFLNYYGRWSRDTFPRYSFVKPRPNPWPTLLFENAMWEQQTAIRNALSGDRGEWLQKEGLGFSARSKFPHFVHSDSTCLGAINTSISIDFLRKVPFRICKRSDCGTPFAADRKGKRYCCQYCAHIVSVRKQREHLKRR